MHPAGRFSGGWACGWNAAVCGRPRAWSAPTTSAISTFWCTPRPCRASSSPNARSGAGRPSGPWRAMGGTIFVDRQSRTSSENVSRQIGTALEAGVAVLLFPEGTSTDGSAVQRFHPTLLEAAVQLQAEMTPAAIGYRVQGGEERAMCWFGDAPFLPHLLRTLGKAGVVAEVEFYPERQRTRTGNPQRWICMTRWRQCGRGWLGSVAS
jgi:hypothetical protein